MTQSNIDPRYVETQEVRPLLRQSQKRRETQKINFMNSRVLDILLIILTLGSGLLLWRGLSVAPGTVSGGPSSLLAETGAIMIGFPTFAVALLLCAWRVRWRINQYEPWWNTHCPACQSDQLKRSRRRPFDRLISKLGIPVRRYVCADCHWEGRRIDPWKVK